MGETLGRGQDGPRVCYSTYLLLCNKSLQSLGLKTRITVILLTNLQHGKGLTVAHPCSLRVSGGI